MTSDDAEDLVYHQLEDSSHLLHGVIHTNGYGHLLRVNGREGGSKFLSGREIMDFWDRLCTTLRVRLECAPFPIFYFHLYDRARSLVAVVLHLNIC